MSRINNLTLQQQTHMAIKDKNCNKWIFGDVRLEFQEVTKLENIKQKMNMTKSRNVTSKRHNYNGMDMVYGWRKNAYQP